MSTAAATTSNLPEDRASDYRDLLNEMTSVSTRSIINQDMWNPTTVSLTDTCEDAFEALIDNGYLSCPIVDTFGSYWGFLDMMDLTTWACDLVDDMTPTERRDESYFRQQRRFREALVSDLRHRPRRREVHPSFSLFHAFENMARFNQHRLCILNSDNSVMGILTQSMIIDFLVDNIDKLGRARTHPIWQLRPFTVVLSVNEKQRAIDAFRMMQDRDVSGLAVVDANGELSDCISVRDLRGINPGGEAFWTLFSTVEEFKDKVRDDFPSAPWTSQYVTRDATLEDVLRKMSTESIHRVFVVDSEANKRPVDVITMTDVMTFLLNQLTKLNPVREGARVGRQRVGQRKNVGWR